MWIFRDIPQMLLSSKGLLRTSVHLIFFILQDLLPVSAGDYNYAGIEDAVIIITDITEGIRDTLQYVPPRFEGYDVYYNYYNYDTKRKEEVSVLSRSAVYGMYVTTKLYGIVGHSYSLDFYCDGKHFESEAQKMEQPLIITDLKVKKVDLGEKEKLMHLVLASLIRRERIIICFHFILGRIPTLHLRALMSYLEEIRIGVFPF